MYYGVMAGNYLIDVYKNKSEAEESLQIAREHTRARIIKTLREIRRESNYAFTENEIKRKVYNP